MGWRIQVTVEMAENASTLRVGMRWKIVRKIVRKKSGGSQEEVRRKSGGSQGKGCEKLGESQEKSREVRRCTSQGKVTGKVRGKLEGV
jgi:hypothetical protein